MRKIIAGFAASVDGYIEGPAGELDWILIDDKMDLAEELKRYDAFFYGRKTYEAALRMDSFPEEGARHYVFSNTLKKPEEPFVLINSDIAKSVENIRRQEGKDIAVFGGAGLLASLLNLKLVDEIAVSFIPVLLGGGKSMVNLLQEKTWLRFINSKRYGNGTLVIRYGVQYTRM